jgi:hypothetical protein
MVLETLGTQERSAATGLNGMAATDAALFAQVEITGTKVKQW